MGCFRVLGDSQLASPEWQLENFGILWLYNFQRCLLFHPVTQCSLFWWSSEEHSVDMFNSYMLNIPAVIFNNGSGLCNADMSRETVPCQVNSSVVRYPQFNMPLTKPFQKYVVGGNALYRYEPLQYSLPHWAWTGNRMGWHRETLEIHLCVGTGSKMPSTVSWLMSTHD